MLTGDNIRENSTLTQPQEQPEEPAGSIDVHNSPCCPKFLMTFRYIACMVLTVRLALNLTETYTSLFPVFEYFTHMGFMITFFHFVLVIQDFWFNECQNSLSPKYSFKKVVSNTKLISFFRSPCVLKDPSQPYTGPLSIVLMEQKQVKLFLFSFFNNKRYRKPRISFLLPSD